MRTSRDIGAGVHPTSQGVTDRYIAVTVTVAALLTRGRSLDPVPLSDLALAAAERLEHGRSTPFGG
jgi:hypothetical protein